VLAKEKRFMRLIVDLVWEKDIPHAQLVRDDDRTFFVQIISNYERRSFV